MSDGETQEIAKMGARLHAIRNAQEKAGVFISSRTAVVNGKLTEDEIMAFTAGLVSVEEVTYKPMPLNDKGGYIKFIANITVTIDIDDLHNRINEWINLSSQEKSNLVEQNKSVQKIISDQSTQIAELENLIKNSNDTKKINEIIKTLDKETLKAQYMAYNQRASSLINRGKDYFERANKSKNENYYNRASNYFFESIDESTAAIQLMPNEFIAYANRGYAYYHIEDYDSALNDYNKVIQINPNKAFFYNERGHVYYGLKNYNKAIEDYTKAIQLNPQDSILYINRGDAYMASDNFEQGIKDYEKVIEIDPKNYKIYRHLGNIYRETNYIDSRSGDIRKNKLADFNKSVEYYTKLTKIEPQNPDGYCLLGYLYLHDLRNCEKAMEYYKKAIEVAPNFGRAYAGLGDCYDNLYERAPRGSKDEKIFYDKAEEYYEKARELGYR